MNKISHTTCHSHTASGWVDEAKLLFSRLIELESESNLPLRREMAVKVICQALDAEFGFWGWGQGHPRTNETVMPIAMVFHGLTDSERIAFFRMGQMAQADKWFRHPFLPLLEMQTQVCKSRPDYWTDEQWRGSELRSMMIPQIQIDEWMVCVRYPTPQIWSSIVLFRKAGRPSFSQQDCLILDLICAGVSWLQSSSTSQSQETDLSGLGTRNTEVLYLLLDGRSRKEIANALGVTTHIVNDCMKQIYNHFGTSSATELAALFLKRA